MMEPTHSKPQLFPSLAKNLMIMHRCVTSIFLLDLHDNSPDTLSFQTIHLALESQDKPAPDQSCDLPQHAQTCFKGYLPARVDKTSKPAHISNPCPFAATQHNVSLKLQAFIRHYTQSGLQNRCAFTSTKHPIQCTIHVKTWIGMTKSHRVKLGFWALYFSNCLTGYETAVNNFEVSRLK